MRGIYHIEGTEMFGYSTINRYLYSLYIYKNTVKGVTDLYPNASVLDLRGYVAHFCYRRLKAFDTLIKVVVEHKDYISATCILRMLGDSVAVFNLVYLEPDIDMLLLRHALYVIDGCEENLKVLPNNDFNRGTMPNEEVEVFNEKLRFNMELRKRLMQEAQQILDASPLQNKNKDAYDQIVKERNWKFKTFKTYKKGTNQYKWAELYEKIGRCEGYDVLTFLSQYIHSLSMSNIVMEMNQENCDGVLIEGLALLKKLNEYTLEFFQPNFLHIMEGFYEPKMRDQILSCYDDAHRPSIEKWNEIVRSSINHAYGN